MVAGNELVHGSYDILCIQDQYRGAVLQDGGGRYILYLAESFIKGLYDQIRFIDLQGREVVRVNLAGGSPVLVDPARLQDKSSRYYVDRALHLERGRVYLSPLDLNVEDDRVEQPIKPVLRFATPVFDSTGTRQGLVVLNYLGDRLLEGFRRAAANIADHVQLLNGQGYWLSSPRPDEAWNQEISLLKRKVRNLRISTLR